VACSLVASAACSNGSTDPSRPLDSGFDGSEAGAVGGDALGDAGNAASDAGVADSGDVAVAMEAGPAQALLRVANWTPDAPASGYDVCLAPAGTTNWSSPIFQQAIASGLEDAGSTGLPFPMVTEYVPVGPGTYDLQLIMAGNSDCTSGVIPTTMGLPSLIAGARVTFAIIGDVRPTNRDARQKVAAFFDDATAANDVAVLRVINAVPSVGAMDVIETGPEGESLTSFANVPFGSVGTMVTDGGSVDPNGYSRVSPATNVGFVALAPGGTVNIATAGGATLSARAVITLAAIDGENGSGRPPRFLMCTDNGAPITGLTPCSALNP
jgi:hypothetical protein